MKTEAEKTISFTESYGQKAQTAQIPVDEPLPEPANEIESETPGLELVKNNSPKLEIKDRSKVQEVEPEPTPAQNSNVVKPATSFREQVRPITGISKSDLNRKLLVKARIVTQTRKRKKLEKIMALFLKKQKITNDKVEKLLHVSDATATRYLSILEKKGKIKQSGKIGKGVSYSRI